MKYLAEFYKNGWLCLLYDDLISYWTFFTVSLIEVAYLFAFEIEGAVTATVFLAICIAGIVASAFSKEAVQFSTEEKDQAILCRIGFLVLFIIAAFVDFFPLVPVLLIPFAVSYTWEKIREIQNSVPVGFPKDSLTVKLFEIIHINWIYVLSYVITIGVPLVLLTLFIAQIDALPVALKIILPIVYVAISPIFALCEDGIAACTISDLFKDNT